MFPKQLVMYITWPQFCKFLSEVKKGHPDNSTPLDKEYVYCALSNKVFDYKITDDKFAVSNLLYQLIPKA